MKTPVSRLFRWMVCILCIKLNTCNVRTTVHIKNTSEKLIMANVASVAVAVEILSESHKRWNMLYQNENMLTLFLIIQPHSSLRVLLLYVFSYFVPLFCYFFISSRHFHPKIFLTGFVSFTLTEKLSCENTHIYAKYLHPNIQNN